MDLLQRLFPDGLWTTQRVIDEIERGVGGYPDLRVLLDLAGSWLRVVENWDLSVESHFRQRYAAVRRGADASVLAVAKEGRQAWTVLTDGKGMIRVCRQEGIRILTTADLLRQALRLGLVTRRQVQQIKADMEARARFRVTGLDS